MKRVVLGLCMILLSSTAVFAASDGVVAKVKVVTGEASVVRKDKTVTAKPDDGLYKGDILKTGPDGSLGITFKDNTQLSLGPQTEVVIDEFLFSPGEGKLAIVTRMVKGTVAYLSGIIGRLSPQAVRFETPVASVGIRGTKFLVKIDE